jgi:hypothetical protein
MPGKRGIRHGALSRSILLDNESHPRFVELLDSLLDEYKPATPGERDLVETMAVSRWRLRRLWTIEAAGFNHETRILLDSGNQDDAPTRAMLAMRQMCNDGRYLELVNRYETSLDREYHRAAHRLALHRARPTSQNETILRHEPNQSTENKEVLP